MRCISSLVSNRREFPGSEEVDRLSSTLNLGANYMLRDHRNTTRNTVPLVWGLQYSVSELPIASVLLADCF